MTVNFDHVLTGVAARLAHDREQHFIENPLAHRIADFAVVQPMRFEFTTLPMRTTKNLCRDIFRADAADAHDRNSTFTGWRGNRGNRILFIHKRRLILTARRLKAIIALREAALASMTCSRPNAGTMRIPTNCGWKHQGNPLWLCFLV